MGVHLRSDCWCSLRASSLRVSLRFGCFEDNEGVGVAPSTSRAAFSCGGVGGSSIHGGRRPQFLFARISRLETTMRAFGIEIRESEIVQIILRQIPERYDVVKTMTLTDPQLTRSRLENTIRSVYSHRKAHKIAKQGPAAGAPAAPPNPHAVVIGRGFGDGGGRGRRRPTKGRRYGTSQRWHAAAAAAVAATLVSGRWHAAAAAATAAMISRGWYSSAAST